MARRRASAKSRRRRSQRTQRDEIMRIDHLSPAAYEARKAAKAARAFSLAWDENEALGLPDDQRRQGAGGTLTDLERKETLWQAYLNIPWISSSIDTTAKRIVSGGYTIDPVVQGEGNEAHYDLLDNFILRTDEDWDFLQFVESVAVDMGIFGEAYAEIVWDGSVPYAIHKIDCLTMTYHLAKNGQILGYTQRLTHSTETIDFEARDIIRWWIPSPRAHMQALSFIEKLNNAVYSDQNMVNWIHKFFRNGARPDFWVATDGDEEEARRLIAFFRENYTGAKNAHVPPVMYGGAQLHEFNKPPVDVDFADGRRGTREEILAVSGVPPAMVNVIETGNIGGGTGESQHKAFQYNTTDPLKRKIFEKFNYRITKQGFNVHDWIVSTKYADYRDDSQVAEVQDRRIRNGSSTIDEERAAMGRRPLPKGGDTAIVVAGKDVIPVERLDELADEQREQAQITIAQAASGAQGSSAEQPGAAKNAQSPEQDNDDAEEAERDAEDTGDDGSLDEPAGKKAESVSPQRRALEQWMQRAITDVTRWHGSCYRGFTTTAAVPEALHQAISRRLEGARTIMQVADIFAEAMDGVLAPAPLVESGGHTGVMVAFFLDAASAEKLALPGGEPAGDLHVTLAYLGERDELALPIDRVTAALAAFTAAARPLEGAPSGIARFTPSDSSDGLAPVVALVNVAGLQQFRADLVRCLEGAGVPVASNFEYTPHITLAYIDAGAPLPVTEVPAVSLRFATVWLASGDERIAFPLGAPLPPEDDGSLAAHSSQEHGHESISHADAAPPAPGRAILEVAADIHLRHDHPAPREYEDAQTDTAHDLRLAGLYISPDHPLVDDGSLTEAAPNPGGVSQQQVTWYPDDVDARLAKLRAAGVAQLRWYAFPGCCAVCFPNDGMIRELGAKFPNGAKLPQCHPNCQCVVYDASKPEQLQVILSGKEQAP